MDPRDELLTVPGDCVRWCTAQPAELAVLDDMVAIDLDWWNTRLDCHKIPVRLAGRDPDGQQVDAGIAFLRRGDLQRSTCTLELDNSWWDLTTLYLCAAWLYAHPHRGRVRRFVDVRNWTTPQQPFSVIAAAFAACERSPALIDADRPQLLDQQAMSSLIHHGWLENPSVSQFTVARYTRYTDLLDHWARQAGTTAELVEMWLTHTWRERVAAADKLRDNHTTCPQGPPSRVDRGEVTAAAAAASARGARRAPAGVRPR